MSFLKFGFGRVCGGGGLNIGIGGGVGGGGRSSCGGGGKSSFGCGGSRFSFGVLAPLQKQ